MTIKSQPNNKKYLRQEYVNRINKGIDFIENNISHRLNLEKISRAAGFSSFHFHRIFKAIIGETLNTYIKRLRIEKAAMMLVYNPKHSITYIALDCGFSSSAAFSRAFKEYYNLSASDYRNGGYIEISKKRKVKSKNGKDKYSSSEYINDRSSILKRRIKMKVTVKEIPEMHIAYIRNIGVYVGNSDLFEELFGKLCKWAGPRNLMNADTKFLSVYYDDPKITDEAKLRLDVCITIPEDTKVEGEISKQTLSAGKYAVARFEIKDSSGYKDAWESIYRDWLPESGYQPDNKPSYEMYENNAKDHPEGIQIVDICIPVKPL
jgi:AraC family transcriptional regulator